MRSPTLLLIALAAGSARPAALWSESFDNGLGTWQTFPGGGELTVQKEVAQHGAALQLRYQVTGKFLAVGTPLATAAGARTLRFHLRTRPAAVVFVTVSEQDGSGYGTFIDSPDDVWQEVELGLDRLRLNEDSTDENARLDTEQLGSFGVADISKLIGRTPAAAGDHYLWLDEVQLATDEAANAYSPDGHLPFMLDRFDAGPLSWLAMSGTLRIDAEAGHLVWDYDGEKPNNQSFCAILGTVGPLPAKGATHLLVTLQSLRPAKLAVAFQEQKRGDRDQSRWYFVIDLPAGTAPQTVAVPLNDLQLDTNNGAGDENLVLDLDQVDTILIGDGEVITNQRPGPNTVRIDELELIGN